MIHIAVMHVPRKVETIDESVYSLYSSINSTLDSTVTVLCDGKPYKGKDKMTKGWIEVLPKNVGCFKHFARSLEWLVANSVDNDILAVLPDDLIYRPFDKLIEKALTPNVGYCAIYTPKELGRRNRWKFGGWQSINGGYDSSYGGGYFMRRETAIKVLEHPFFINHRDNYEKNQQIDHCIPEVMYQLGLKQLFHVPSLSKHIGLTSTIGHVHTEAEDPWLWK